MIDMYTQSRYIYDKIFQRQRNRKYLQWSFSKKFPINIQKIALRKLIMLNSSNSLNDLRIPPSNHLEKLTGNLDGYYSIRINDQYRVIFKVDNNGADVIDVRIVDYH